MVIQMQMYEMRTQERQTESEARETKILHLSRRETGEAKSSKGARLAATWVCSTTPWLYVRHEHHHI